MIYIYAPIIFGEIGKQTMESMIKDSVSYFSKMQQETLNNSFNMFFPFAKAVEEQEE